MEHHLKQISCCQFLTDRLEVKNWNNGVDNDDLKADMFHELSLLLSPKVMEFLPEPLQKSCGDCDLETWVDARNDESDVFMVRDKTSSKLFGLLILAGTSETSNHSTIRIGYLLDQNCWGQGIATELVKGFINWCISQNIKGELLGGVVSDNTASSQVLLKCGFSIVNDEFSEQNVLYCLKL